MALLGTLQVGMALETASFGTQFNSFTKDIGKRADRFSKTLSGMTSVGSLLGGTDLGAYPAPGIDVVSRFSSSFASSMGGSTQTRFNEFTKSIQEGAIKVKSTWTSAMKHVGRAFDEFVKTGKLNFSDLVRSIIAELASAALKNAFNGLLQGIMGISGSGAGGGSLFSGIGSIFGSIVGGFGSFEGGGYTGNGPRAGGLDGRGGRLAMIHPQETVIDHTRVKKAADRSRRGDILVSTPITLMPGVSKEELAEILPMLKRDIIDSIPRLIAQGGRYAGAYGQ
ncbi:phage tail tape measure C-terminal domain-containing protein [Luteolibacter luteus]|uniref:Bacteriophage tail tape measure C-terminal domain-containing protein n=1 Tax=Luteolibacter luteus TaxID=2728835 RepID=A0A858RF82_9BACT|nr:phage tail tape measure C-terminal domain-containing protein [Luteolibacter luteus]QJE95224.1 hypothetical protein HHL09_05355 [Luteolibacter luteus]